MPDALDVFIGFPAMWVIGFLIRYSCGRRDGGNE